MTWEEYQLPSAPAQCAGMIAVCQPDNGGTMEILFSPDSVFDINRAAETVKIGEVRKYTSGGKVVLLYGAGDFDLGWARITRKGIALRIASRLAGLTLRRIQHDYLNRAEVQ